MRFHKSSVNDLYNVTKVKITISSLCLKITKKAFIFFLKEIGILTIILFILIYLYIYVYLFIYFYLFNYLFLFLFISSRVLRCSLKFFRKKGVSKVFGDEMIKNF